MGRGEYLYEERPAKRKKKSHKLYAFIVMFLGIVIIFLSVVLLFYVQRIEVAGNSYCTDRQIVEVVQNDKYSVNSLYVWAKYALGCGEQLPCLERIQVSLGLPWVLKVEVKEKQIVGYLYSDKKEYLYFDSDGMVVKTDTASMAGIPRVEGISADKIKLYSTIDGGNSKIFKEILEASQELKKYDMSVEKIVCKNDRIYLYIGKICVALGNNVTSEKIAQISPIIEKLGKKKGTLHLENYAEGRETITFSVGEFPEEN